MRITQHMLQKIAEETVTARTNVGEGILAVYLCGSMIDSYDPLFGGSADIDLVFIYESREPSREIVRMNADVTVDIQHHPRRLYEPPRELRNKHWLGHTVYNCKPMYDPQHFFDFVQAGSRGMFDQPEYIRTRIEPHFQTARSHWSQLQLNAEADITPNTIRIYLDALESIVQGLVGIKGTPLTERRLIAELSTRMAELDEAGFAAAIIGLMGASLVQNNDVQDWLPKWDYAYQKAIPADPRLSPHRHRYYRGAIEAFLAEGATEAAVWPLLRTWTDLLEGVAKGDQRISDWEVALSQLGLGNGQFADRVKGFDVFLDRVEEYFDGWKENQGLPI